MDLITVIFILILIGLALAWIPMDSRIKVLIVVVTVLWLLNLYTGFVHYPIHASR